MSAEPANTPTIAAWNTVLSDKSCPYEHLLVQGLEADGSQLFERIPPAPAARVLDVGSGFGNSTVLLAEFASSASDAGPGVGNK